MVFARIGLRTAARKITVRAQAQDLLLAQLLYLEAKMPACQIEEGRLDELIGPERGGAWIGRRVAPARLGVHQSIEKEIEGGAITGTRRRCLRLGRRRLRQRRWFIDGYRPVNG